MIEARNHPLWEKAFLHYLRDLTCKRFHAVRVEGRERLEGWDPQVPTLLYANHSSWWDGFMAYLVTHMALGWRFHVMMEERHLARYRFFSRIGAFGVEREQPRAARRSLEHALGLLAAERSTVWIFPQGVLRPNDVRPLHFYRGAAWLAQGVWRERGAVRLLPVAMRYEFLHEDRPEALIALGPPRILAEEPELRELSGAMEREVTELLDRLCRQVRAEDLAGYAPLLEGGLSLNKRLDALKVRLGWMPASAFDPRNGR